MAGEIGPDDAGAAGGAATGAGWLCVQATEAQRSSKTAVPEQIFIRPKNLIVCLLCLLFVSLRGEGRTRGA